MATIQIAAKIQREIYNPSVIEKNILRIIQLLKFL